MSKTYGGGKRQFGRLEHLRQWRRAQWPGGLSLWVSRAARSRRARPEEAQEPSSGYRAKRVLWPCGRTTSPMEARSSCEAASWSVTGAPLIASSRSPTATRAAAAPPPGRTPRITEGRPLAPPVVPSTRHVRYARGWYAYRARTVRPPPPHTRGQAAVRLRWYGSQEAGGTARHGCGSLHVNTYAAEGEAGLGGGVRLHDGHATLPLDEDGPRWQRHTGNTTTASAATTAATGTEKGTAATAAATAEPCSAVLLRVKRLGLAWHSRRLAPKTRVRVQSRRARGGSKKRTFLARTLDRRVRLS